jgi:hypothetical protein
VESLGFVEFPQSSVEYCGIEGCGKEFVEHYNLERPNQSRGNLLLPDAVDAAAGIPRRPLSEREIVCRARLGGLLKHYQRQAA